MKTKWLLPFSASVCFIGLSFLTGCSGASNSGGGSTPTVTAPTVTSVTPATVSAGAAATTLTVNGSGFLSSTSIQVGGVVETSTYVSSSQVTAIVPATQLAQGAMLSVIALNNSSTSGGGPVINLEVDNPTPVITQFVPASFAVGSASTSVSVTGTGFVPTTVIQAGGNARSTTYVSATQVNVILTAADFATPGSLALTAVNPSPGGGTSAASSLAINNPAPGAIVVSPATVSAGTTTATTVTVTGTNFIASTTAQVGGSVRPTTVVSATQLTFQLTVADQAVGGALPVTVTTPAPGGGTSAAVSITVTNPAPGLTGLSPSTVPTNTSGGAVITVTGTNFVASSVVQIGGANRATTYVSPTQLTATLIAADQAAAGRLNVTVVNAAPGGGTSGTAILTVALPTLTPAITVVSPTQLVAGSANSSIAILGTNLSAVCIVNWNGTPLTTTYVSSTTPGPYVIGQVPASLLTTPGSVSLTVSCSTATPPASNVLSLSIVNPPPPTLTGLSVNSGPINTSTSLYLYGTGFTSKSTATFNGASIPVTYVNSTQLSVTVPAASLTVLGNYPFTVSTPAPGGGTSAPQYFTAYIGIANNSMIYNPVNGLFYVSVPSSAGAPYGNSVVSVDPVTGALGTPIFVGSEPDRMAITSDGNYLWVGLDGASAVRKVNLVTGVAGLQFSLGGNTGIYANPPIANALAALPGATDSVVVSTNGSSYNGALAIYDSGVIRGTSTTYNSIYGGYYALQVDGTRNEVYAGATGYTTYTYGATGLTLKANGSTSATYATSATNEMQIAGGQLYTDLGQVFDPESGSLLGSLYVTGTTLASGPTIADTTLGKIFNLNNGGGYSSSSPTQIQVFNTSNYAVASSSTIPVGIASNASYVINSSPSRLTRWGTNGLAFRTSLGVYSLRSNLVKDLSGVAADLGVTVAQTGSLATGGNTTYTATVTNAGPAAATNVALSAFLPASGVLVSATPSAGSCSTTNGVTCDLGGLASGSTASIVFIVTQTTAGSVTATVQVSGSETDSNSGNNQASSTVTVTGSAYNLAPTLTSVSPAAILAGSGDTHITLTGTGFTSGTTVQLGGTALSASLTSGTQLVATVPSAQLTTLGWAPLTVSNAAPGGGTSSALPLSVYSVITLGVNHILYDPYSRKIMASVGSGSTSVTGNSIIAITPETGALGTAVAIGSQPTNLALTSDGQILYTILAGSGSVARYNMITQAVDFTYTVPNNSSFAGGITLRGIAAQPGTENTVALDIASFSGNAIYDFNPTTKTAAIRGQASGPYSGSCIQFLDSTNLLAFDTDTSGATLDHYTVTSSGFTYYNYSQYTQSTLNGFGCFKVSGGLAFGNAGGVANPYTVPATQLGVFPITGGGTFSSVQSLAPDTSLQQAFFLANTNASTNGAVDGIKSFNQNTYMPSGTVSLNMATTEGNTSYSGVDLIRWGQDGLAVLTSGGHIYLLRGAAVVPQLLGTNSVATLSASSVSSITHGAGNALLTLTGSNFLPGVAVSWNGAYRTTTIVDATHVTVAIPFTDLAAAGSASLTATNPGASASNALTFTIN